MADHGVYLNPSSISVLLVAKFMKFSYRAFITDIADFINRSKNSRLLAFSHQTYFYCWPRYCLLPNLQYLLHNPQHSVMNAQGSSHNTLVVRQRPAYTEIQSLSVNIRNLAT